MRSVKKLRLILILSLKLYKIGISIGGDSMLTKMVLENFYSFKERTEVDLRKTSYTICPENVSESKILKGAVFFGANASGKTNIIKGIKYLLEWLFLDSEHSNMLREALCLFGDTKQYHLEYHFDIDSNEIIYKIGVDIDSEEIYEELILNKQTYLKRDEHKATVYNKNDIREYEEDVPKDGSFLRVLYFNTRFAGNDILIKWMNFLKNSIYCDMYLNNLVGAKENEINILDYLEHNGTQRVNEFFEKYNFEQKIEYENEAEGSHFGLKADKKLILFRRESLDDPIPYYMESLGNQLTLKILPVIFTVMDNGGMLAIDEFSSGLHNRLEELLIKFFMKNSQKSQLFLVSHSTNILKNTILRPDQEYAVYFDGENGSKIKRFSEEQPRNAQNIEKMYNSGIFGGLPDYEEV